MIGAGNVQRGELIRRWSIVTPLARTAAGLTVFVGLWFLLTGIAAYHGGQSTQNLYRGTMLEDDRDANQITSNAMREGKAQILEGMMLILLGGVFGVAGGRRQVAAATGGEQATVPSSSAVLIRRIVIGVAIFFAVLLGVPLLLLIFGVIGPS
jgi:hypothetical protein